MKFKTVLVTGASRGIGRDVAKGFAREGFNVIINYSSSVKEAETLCEEINSLNGGRAIAIKADVSNAEEVKNMVEVANKKFGKIHTLVNNAGIEKIGLFQDMEEGLMDKIMQVNVKGVFNVTKAVLPQMISAKEGKIINISSVLGIMGSVQEVVYSASKGAVIAFTKALAKEVGPSGINVNAIAPGAIQTDMMKEFSQELLDKIANQTSVQRIGQTEDIVNACLFLADNKSSFIQGAVLPVTGGWLY